MAIKELSDKEIRGRFQSDNPWWEKKKDYRAEQSYRRHYFSPLFEQASQRAIRRAVLLMGPRRVGKTVLLHQVIEQFIARDIEASKILYCSLDDPVFLGLPLERLVACFLEGNNIADDEEYFVFFDEIQYLTNWEIHLKSLVDRRPKGKFIASGSAAAALRAQSAESGAGRFSDFLLPPMNFKEFVDLRIGDAAGLVDRTSDVESRVEEFNELFFQYINFGGFPEMAIGDLTSDQISKFVGGDIIEKALSRDLPNIYGIADFRDLAQFFRVIAFNSGQEISPGELAQSTGLTAPTIEKFFTYLEAAFLVRRIYKIDRSAKRFKRASRFKVYLTNPSLRSAMFGFSAPDDQDVGLVIETAFLAQWRPGSFGEEPVYAHWDTGEVDFVVLHPGTQKPRRIYEVKWSDRMARNGDVLKPLISFAKKHRLKSAIMSSRTHYGTIEAGNIKVHVWPTSVLAYIQATVQTDPNPHKELRTILGDAAPLGDA